MKNILLISFQIVLGLYTPAIMAQPKPEALKPITQKYNLNSVLFKNIEGVRDVKSIKANQDPFTGIKLIDKPQYSSIFTPDNTSQYQPNWGNAGDNSYNPNVPYFLRSLFNRR
jgi:hypothetical protein